MLHQQIHRGYRQTLYLPAVEAPPESVLHVKVLGRLKGTGHFDLHQIASQCSLHVVQSGQGEVSFNGVRHAVRGGDAFCFYPGDHIHYREDPQSPWRYTWIGLAGSAALPRLNAVGFNDRRVHQAAITSPEFWQWADATEASLTSERHGANFLCAAAWQVLDLFEDQRVTVHARDPVAALARIVESGYDRGLRIEDLARDIGVDRSTLFRRFREAYGCSPRDWLLRVRLDRARDLLLRGELTVAEVATRCDFSDARGFTRAFTARFDTSPGQMRGQRKLRVK